MKSIEHVDYYFPRKSKGYGEKIDSISYILCLSLNVPIDGDCFFSAVPSQLAAYPKYDSTLLRQQSDAQASQHDSTAQGVSHQKREADDRDII